MQIASAFLTAACGVLYFSCSEMNPAAVSNEKSTPKVAEVYCPWSEADIGSPGATGSAYGTKNIFVVTGSGADIQGTSDAFHFVYKTLQGNGQLVMAPQTITNTNGWAKAGLMIRENLNANAKNMLVAITPSNGVTSQYRSTTGGSTSWVGGNGESVPYYLKIVRNGSTITTYKSSNGSTWTQIQSVSISMTTNVFIGMAVCSHASGTLCTSNFLMATPAVITQQPTNSSVCPGDWGGFTFTDDGCDNYSYQWFRNGVAVSNGDNYMGANARIMFVKGVAGSSGTYGNYYCRINYLGMITYTNTVSFTQPSSCP
jgi:hypothetical protein